MSRVLELSPVLFCWLFGADAGVPMVSSTMTPHFLLIVLHSNLNVWGRERKREWEGGREREKKRRRGKEMKRKKRKEERKRWRKKRREREKEGRGSYDSSKILRSIFCSSSSIPASSCSILSHYLQVFLRVTWMQSLWVGI